MFLTLIGSAQVDIDPQSVESVDVRQTRPGTAIGTASINDCTSTLPMTQIWSGSSLIQLYTSESPQFLCDFVGVPQMDSSAICVLVGLHVSIVRKGGRIGVINLNFDKKWATGSGRTCVLITPKKLNEMDLHAALKKYLPEEQVARIQVRRR